MKVRHIEIFVAGCLIAVALTGCGRDDSNRQAAAKTAELEAREQQLAQREAAIKAKEAEQEELRRAAAEAAEREAARVAAEKEAAEKEVAAKEAAAKAAAARRAAAKQAAATTAGVKTSPVSPVTKLLEVPAGTELLVELAADVSTKTAKVGQRFDARLVSALMSGNHLVAPAGARVAGTITEVVSGSHQIGATPALGMRFDQLELADGRQIAVRGELQRLGESEKTRDVAKILGGAAAGAVIGHQIEHGTKGKVIGGIVGGAAGAAVAKNTGTEVDLPAGTQITIALAEGFVVKSN